MPDRYSQIVNAPVVSTVSKQVGLPQPVDLDRFRPGSPVVAGLAKQLHEDGKGRGVISICAAGGQGVVAILEGPEGAK